MTKAQISSGDRSYLDGFTAIKVEELVSVRVANQLRDMIVTGKIALGEQLSENALAQVLGVSRTPVREAFMKLESEKMVDVRPKRGTFVFTCDAREAREICELRSILETGAMHLACERDREGLFKRLGEVAARSQAVLNVSPQAYQQFDIEFHNVLFAVADNANLSEAYARIAGRVSALRWRLTTSLSQIRDSHEAHLALVDAIRDERDDEAERILQKHVGRTAEVIAAMFRGDDDHLPLEVIAGVR